MTKKRFVLPGDHYITRAPVMGSVVMYMWLDLYHAPGWLWGVMGTLMSVIWIGWVVVLLKEETKPLPGYGEQHEND